MGVICDFCEEVLFKFYVKVEYVDLVYIVMCILNGLLIFIVIFGNVVIIFVL